MPGKVRDRKSDGDKSSESKSLLPTDDPDEKDDKKMSFLNSSDRSSVLLLFLLYILQGIPLGISGSIPMLLADKKIGYQNQALFSFVFWPFSLKLLWAPIVDGAYSSTFGRRKSWLIPTQFAIGAVMLILSYNLDSLLEVETPNILALTACFFFLNFGAATQDIAVDGWALTMLSRKNVGLASTCNSVGQTAGYFLGYVLYMALESEQFCNKYLRQTEAAGGIVTLAGFLRFWALVFVVVTTLVMLFKKEKSDREEENTSVIDTYKQLWQIIRLPSVTQYVIILLTSKVGFAAESIVGLKLIELGVKRESMAMLAVPLIPLQIGLPLLISKYTSGPKPMDVFLKAMKYRLVMGAVLAWVVHITPQFAVDGEFTYSYFAFILAIYALHQIPLYCMFVSQMSFNAKISDPRIGGTYMTLLNTVANLGGNWPSTVSMWFADKINVHYCKDSLWNSNSCKSNSTIEMCTNAGGSCESLTIDGYYVITAVSILLGVFWMMWRASTLRRLQIKGTDAWRTQL